MSKHTPGPWQVHGSHVYSADPDRALIAQVFNPGSKASDYPLIQNARLIAAAPMMYEALKAAEPYLRHANVDYNVYVQARAAIAKAEGA